MPRLRHGRRTAVSMFSAIGEIAAAAPQARVADDLASVERGDQRVRASRRGPRGRASCHRANGCGSKSSPSGRGTSADTSQSTACTRLREIGPLRERDELDARRGIGGDVRLGRVQDDLVLTTRFPEAAVPGEAPRLLVVLEDASPHRIATQALRVLGEGLVDPVADPLSTVLGQDADHRVHGCSGSKTAGPRRSLPARRRSSARSHAPSVSDLDEVRDLVDVDDVARDAAPGSSAHCS